MEETSHAVTRRRAIQLLALVGITGPAATRLLAQDPVRVTPEVLRAARSLLDQEIPDERLEVVSRALQRNFDQFQIVRDLEIDDRVEPTPAFDARWR